MTLSDVQVSVDPFKVRMKGQEVQNDGKCKDPLPASTENVKDITLHVWRGEKYENYHNLQRRAYFVSRSLV